MNEPKYTAGDVAEGKHYGRFYIVGRRWSDAVSEWIYGAFQMSEDGRRFPGEVQLTESCFK